MLENNNFINKYTDIINRYIYILMDEMISSGWYSILEIKSLEGDETNDIHLLWMLNQLLSNKSQSETKKHRWLGYIQGIMTVKGYINVLEERELTRNIFKGE